MWKGGRPLLRSFAGGFSRLGSRVPRQVLTRRKLQHRKRPLLLEVHIPTGAPPVWRCPHLENWSLQLLAPPLSRNSRSMISHFFYKTQRFIHGRSGLNPVMEPLGVRMRLARPVLAAGVGPCHESQRRYPKNPRRCVRFSDDVRVSALSVSKA